MKTILKLEELGIFLLSIWLFILLDFSWWLFPLLLLVPDLCMAGYLVNATVGAYLYNIVHHRLLAILLYLLGIYLEASWIQFTGVLLFGHIAMDRMFGIGLKYSDDFKHTHLGWIGARTEA